MLTHHVGLAPPLLSQSAIITAYMDVIHGLAGGDPLMPACAPGGGNCDIGSSAVVGTAAARPDVGLHEVAGRREQSFEGENYHDRWVQ